MIKTKIIVLTIDVVVMSIYQNIVKLNISNKKFNMINNIILYDDISIVQIQLIAIINSYLNF